MQDYGLQCDTLTHLKTHFDQKIRRVLLCLLWIGLMFSVDRRHNYNILDKLASKNTK